MRRAALALLVFASACRRTAPSPSPPQAAIAHDAALAALDAAAEAEVAPAPRASTGPYEVPFLGKRTVYYVAPNAPGKQRLMAMLHGMCNPPGYACGLWSDTAKDLGFLVCPTGDGSCGPSMYNAPTWVEPETKIDEDLETAIAKVDEQYPGELARNDAVLLGFSRGAYVSVKIAAAHPGRWPYLVLIEANVNVTATQLRAAGVRGVALIAGELGSQLAGERKTAERLAKEGYPAKLWVMPKAGHHYSSNIESIMREAVTWVTSLAPSGGVAVP
jgi:predicted esterase